MLKKTRFRLTLWNTSILLFILFIFAVYVFTFTKVHLTKMNDLELKNYSKIFASSQSKEEQETNYKLSGIQTIQWSQEGQPTILVGTLQEEELNDLQTVIKQDFSTIETKLGKGSYKVEKYYRVFTLKNHSGTIQFIKDITSERLILRKLSIVLGIGFVFATIISVISGLLLAEKALLPIKKSWRKQRQFVGDASHELRTPLSIIQLNLELLFRHPQHTVEQEAFVIKETLTEVKRLNKLVYDLLTLARGDSNELQIMKEPVRIHEIVDRVTSQFRVITEAKEIHFVTENKKATLIGDPERLTQLLIIIIDNSIKYTPKHGEIWVKCHESNSSVDIHIRDTGKGISENDLTHIFDRFYRGDQARTKQKNGFGLGLSIAKWIVDVHHGTIKVTSKLGKGTEVFIRLPKK